MASSVEQTRNPVFERTEFVAELTQVWRDSAKKLEADGYIAAAVEVQNALRVLKRTYGQAEMVAAGSA